MYLSSVEELKIGDVLAKEVYDHYGNLLLRKGSKLNKSYINKLKNLNLEYIYIEEKKETKKESKKYTNKRNNKKLVPKKIKREARIIARGCIKKINSGDSKLNESEINDLIKMIENIIDGISDNDDLIENLQIVRSLKNELFFHLTNVAILSLVIGKKLNYNRKMLKMLGLGAFLHDIGKAMVSADILNKPGRLTKEEFEEVKKHSLYGYKILSRQPDIPEVAARIAYQHHERCDGSGYPKGITKRFIDQGGRIVAIADVFDAMINNRVYRDSIKVKEVIEYLYAAFTENKMDRELVGHFLKMIVPYPVGTKVKLNIGCEAVVVRVNEEAKLRPVIRLLKFSSLDYDQLEIDLSKNHSIDIIDEVD
ncbi:HD-GYP domain-containing protein [Halonatronum saccharophilum]|uniref:HD-GYP domain-containing protein n=1 Tax=Halonatronum saccharophilum TaxID=150060 RepID=UPI0004B7FBA3|nr:HD-GYP domain-containing protein [Halonatronum saccharophilum]